MIYKDGDFGFYACRMSAYSRLLAQNYAKLGYASETLAALRDSADYAIMYDNASDSHYTSPLVDRLEYRRSNTSKNYTNTDCQLLEGSLENSVFDFVRETDEFRAIEAELTKHV